MKKSVYRQISIELDEKLQSLQQELAKAGVPMSKISVGRIVAGKIMPDININIKLFKAKRRDKRVQVE
jgi:hypothetical protein